MYCVQWDVDSLDWKDPTPEQITQNVLSKIKNGSIILMHNGATNTPEALPSVIEGIQKAGYEIVPISQILLKCDYYTDVEGKMCAKETATTKAEE
jgi:peptidoglycan/xylan/chitin deacetylase (PgdA/CDA1 family)